MGKGDKRSRKGKRIAKSYGVYRPRTAKHPFIINGTPKVKKVAKKAAEKKVIKKKAAPVEKVVAEEVAVVEAPVVEAIAVEAPVAKESPKPETKKPAKKEKKPAAKKEAKPDTKKEPKPTTKKGGKDDLKKIEGIGPATEKVFNEAGITSFAELASSKLVALKEILAAKGSRYKLLVPDTWSEQSALAAEDKWDDLKKLQDTLDKGKRKS